MLISAHVPYFITGILTDLSRVFYNFVVYDVILTHVLGMKREYPVDRRTEAMGECSVVLCLKISFTWLTTKQAFVNYLWGSDLYSI